MKIVTTVIAMTLGVSASAVMAEQMLNVDGTDYPLTELMATCQSITNDPAAQIACFGDISRMLEEQSGGTQEAKLTIPEALEALRSVAQYQDEDSGLVIAGTDCNIQVLYFNNYFPISRRNISTVDLYSAQFDASKLQFDQIAAVQGGQAPLSKAVMDDGATATVRGGVALESSQNNFAPRSPAMTLDVYANEVVTQLPAREGQSFEFVLVHPQRSSASADIMNAFKAFVTACKS